VQYWVASNVKKRFEAAAVEAHLSPGEVAGALLHAYGTRQGWRRGWMLGLVSDADALTLLSRELGGPKPGRRPRGRPREPG
jgi:hypothetical protein